MRLELPNTDSISELVEFYENNCMEDFADEMEEVTELTVNVSVETAEAIKGVAMSAGESVNTVVERWIAEGIANSSRTIEPSRR